MLEQMDDDQREYLKSAYQDVFFRSEEGEKIFAHILMILHWNWEADNEEDRGEEHLAALAL